MILDTYNLPQAHRHAPPGKIDCFGATDRGLVRELNEDQFLVADLRKALHVHHTSLAAAEPAYLTGGTHGQLLLVADGLGGHSSGERASTLAVDCLARFAVNAMHWCARLDECDDEQVFAEWEQALRQCDKQVHAEGESRPERRGMGTTLTMAYVAWPNAYVLHAGDSRCYLMREGRLSQVTIDHTLAQKFVEAGMIAPDRASESRLNHVLWNAIGGSTESVKAEAHKLELALGDVLLLCTDGLTKGLSDERIAAVLDQVQPAADICQQLIDEANQAGGDDNCTVVVAKFVAETDRQAAKASSLTDTVPLDDA